MAWMKSFGVVCVSAVLAVGCGTADTGEDGTPDAGTPPVPTRLDHAQEQLDAFACPAGSAKLVDGMNTGFMVGGKSRAFHVTFPKIAGDKAVGVIFSWHGFGDTVDNWRNGVPLGPDARADFPFVLVVPDDTNLQPTTTPPGLDWDIFNSKPGDANLEGALVEGVLGCLKSQVKIDVAHVHSIGFSAGAIATAMLHSRYPKLFHSVVVISGAWFNDKKTVDAVKANIAASPAASFLGNLTLDWGALATTETGAVLASHGGGNDTYGVFGYEVIDFEASAGFSGPYLRTNTRGVIDCPHTSGHTLPPYYSLDAILDFFQKNPLPPETATVTVPASLASKCSVLP